MLLNVTAWKSSMSQKAPEGFIAPVPRWHNCHPPSFCFIFYHSVKTREWWIKFKKTAQSAGWLKMACIDIVSVITWVSHLCGPFYNMPFAKILALVLSIIESEYCWRCCMRQVCQFFLNMKVSDGNLPRVYPPSPTPKKTWTALMNPPDTHWFPPIITVLYIFDPDSWLHLQITPCPST